MRVALIAGLCFASLCLSSASRSQTLAGPISLVIGAAPGGSADATVRIVASQLQEELHTSVIVDNRPGADMLIATRYVSRQAPDGDTLLYLPAGPATVNVILYPQNAIDPVTQLTPLSMMAVVPLVVLVSPNLPVRSFQDLVDYAKARPMEMNYASAAATHRIAVEMMMLETGMKMTRVQYNGGVAMLTALLSNEVQVAVLDLGNAMQAVRSGARALAVASPDRAPELPEAPTTQEQGYAGFKMDTWGAFFGPPGMTDRTAGALNAALARVLSSPKVISGFANVGFTATSSSPAELVAKIKDDQDKLRTVITRANLKF